jgi:hypothetical protein
MRRWHTLLSLIAALLLLLIAVAPVHAQSGVPEGVHIFFSAGCADCWPYVEETLIPTLQAGGVVGEMEIHDFTRPGGRQLLADQGRAVGLPRHIADSLYAFVPRPDGGYLVVLGHVPPELLAELLGREDVPRKLVIQQPKMHGQPQEYRLWSFTGKVLSFPIDRPLDATLPLLPATP